MAVLVIVYKYPDIRKLEVFAKYFYIYTLIDYAEFFKVYKNGPSNNLLHLYSQI